MSSRLQYPEQALDRRQEETKDRPSLSTVYAQHKFEQALDKALAAKRAKEGK